MNIKILYEPYVLFFILAILISIGYYVYMNQQEEKNENEEEGTSLIPNTIICVLSSYILMLMTYFCYKYFSFNGQLLNPLQKSSIKETQSGGGIPVENEEKEARRQKIMERLTIVDDDVDVSILED